GQSRLLGFGHPVPGAKMNISTRSPVVPGGRFRFHFSEGGFLMSATATQTTTPTPTNPDHDERGRFARGNKGGPGNPYARHTAARGKAAAEALTPQHIQVVMLAMWELAAKGDKEAARIVLAYGPGKPQPGADPDSLDAHEMRNYFAQIVPMPAVIEMMKGM